MTCANCGGETLKVEYADTEITLCSPSCLREYGIKHNLDFFKKNKIKKSEDLNITPIL